MSFTTPPIFNRNCKRTTGGIAEIFLFDPKDFDWTQTAPPNGSTAIQPYSAVAVATGAGTTPKMYPIGFEKKSAEYTYKQSVKGSSGKYEHQVEFKMPDLSQLTTNWNRAIDDIGVCGGVGMAIVMNSGKIFIAGEMIVNGVMMAVAMEMVQDGTSATSGKLMDDENGVTAILKGDYSRPLYEFTGGYAALRALTQ